MLRFIRSRAAKKFFRQRLAIFAMAVTGAYFLIALFVAFGMLTREEADTPVGPREVPGFFETSSPEKRLERCETYLDRVDAIFNSSDQQSAIERAGFLTLKVSPELAKSPEKLKEKVDQGWELYEQLALSVELSQQPEQLKKLRELEELTSELYPHPSGWDGFVHRLEMLLGTDRQGRSILLRAVYSINVAIKVGVVTALAAVLIGALMGGAAGYFGGWVDHAVIWLYTMLSSIPYLVLLIVLLFAFKNTRFDGTLIPLYAAMIVTFWVGPCRVIRGETLKLKETEYVQAAKSLGFGPWYILLRHVLPNAAHLMLINFSLLFIGAIKSEVILSFLGLGVKGEPSWGIMISQSGSEVITGFFWQIGAATAFMFGLVLAFNVLSDAIQDAYDPKHSG